MFNTLIFLAFLGREQPPSGGCVLKLYHRSFFYQLFNRQPPSGGCVLKRFSVSQAPQYRNAATFGWLCVETSNHITVFVNLEAATFGWLCVETFYPPAPLARGVAAATFGWLCVETIAALKAAVSCSCSHLRVAVC